MRDALARPVVSVYLEPNRPVYAAVAVMDIVILDIVLKDEKGNAVDLTGCSVVVAAQDREKTVLYTGNIVEPLAGAVRAKVQPDVVGRYALSARVCTNDTEDVTFFLGAMSVAAEDPDAGPANSIRSLTSEMLDAQAQATSGIETLGTLINTTTAAVNSANAASESAAEAANAANTAAGAANTAADSANNAANTAAAYTQELGNIDALVAGRVQEANTAAASAASSAEQAGVSANAAANSQQASAQSAQEATASASNASSSASAAQATEENITNMLTDAASFVQEISNEVQTAQTAAQTATQAAQSAAQSAQSVNQWRHRGEWASGTNYSAGDGYVDVVEHAGSSYVCLAAHQATNANKPGIGASFADFWRLLAEKGQPGEQGVPGIGTSSVESVAQNVTETVQSLGNLSGSVLIDASLGNIVTGTVTGALTLSVSNVGSGCRVLTFILVNAGAATITWPNGIMWPDGAAPVLTVAGKDLLTLMSHDNGATWYGAVVGSDFK